MIPPILQVARNLVQTTIRKGCLGTFRKARRLTALLLLGLLLHSSSAGLFQGLYAETAGSTAPEVTKFEPVDTTDMVNLASGDFSYTIPVINVPGPEGGYPLALNYHAGIQHGEEASWVGLGWNIQPGSITRSVRGYPDDFRGVGINTNNLSNVYETYSLDLLNEGVTWGVSYTSYKGWGGYVGLGIEAEVWYAGFDAKLKESYKWHYGSEGSYRSNDASLTVGYGFASGAEVNVGVSSHWDSRGGWAWGTSAGLGYGGASAGVAWDSISGSSINMGVGMLSVGTSLGGGGNSSTNFGVGSAHFASYSGGGQQSRSFGFGPFSYSKHWIDKNDSEIAYGYYYHTVSNTNQDRVNEWITESDPTVIPGDSKEHALAAGLHYLPSNDGYSVMGQGTGGSLKLTRLEDRVYRPRRLREEWTEGSTPPWGTTTPESDPRFAPRFVFNGDNTETITNPGDIGLTQSRLGELVTSPMQDVASQISQANIPSTATQVFLGKSFMPGSRVVKESVDSTTSLFSAFNVWEADGKRYTYGEPVYNLNSETISANRPTIGSNEWFRSKSIVSQKYAYAWYLTELRYPDYWAANPDGTISNADHGGWVKFTYINGSSDYRWHTSPDGQLNDGPLNRVDKLGKDKAGMMYSMQSGAKELKYLNMIETATHKAIFVTSPRADSLEVQDAGVTRSGSLVLTDNHNGTYDLAFSETLPGQYVDNGISTNIDFPGLASGAIQSWSNLSNTTTFIPETMGQCDNNQATQNIGTDSAVFSSQCNINIAGIPLTVASLTRSYSDVEQDTTDNSTGNPQCTTMTTHTIIQTVYSYHATLVIKIDDATNPNNQFWANPSPVSGAFNSIRTRWSSLVSIAAANGGTVSLGPNSMQRLDDIYLIEKSTGALIKQVHFFYSYRLAPGTPNTDPATNPTRGKLTLEAIQTYGQGGKSDASATLPPYVFEYGSNPAWGTKYCYDRWGFFKSDGGPWNHRDVNGADQAAWSLTKITLPTGGTIQIQYEPKDYTRVQDRVPLNPRANAGQVSHYLVDLDPWIGTTPWPVNDDEWTAFKAKVYGNGSTAPTPFHLFTPKGITQPDGTAIHPALSTLGIQNTIPIESAPNPKDLKLWLAKTNQDPASTYANLQKQAQQFANLQPDSVLNVSVPDAYATVTPPAQAAQSTSTAPVERMVNIVFEYWTGGNRAQRLLNRPHQVMTNDDIGNFADDDRGDRIVKSVLVRMVRKMDVNGGADMFITDPTFDWPKEAPNSMYVTWTANPTQAKIGGGVRVKRILSFDGQRSYNTSYTYTDYVDGAWISSGVAAQEPPPFGYSASDDRVIYTEKGGWANEGGGGIYHSRVVVRHSWSEDPAPSGSTMNSGGTASSPMGESVFRFITPRDLPHQERDVDYAKTVWKDQSGVFHDVKVTPLPTDTTLIAGIYTNSARVTEIMNVGSWWGQLLWKEDRDSTGHPLNRVENRYTQLEGYLRLFPSTGYDLDVEKVWGGAPRPSDMSYHWADNQTTYLGDGSPRPNLPLLTNQTAGNKAKMGQDFVSTVGLDPKTSDTFRGYLNASVNVTLINETMNTRVNRHPPHLAWKSAQSDPNAPIVDDGDYSLDPPASGWHSSVIGVREISFAPLVSEVRTYGEGQKLLGVTRNSRWDRRTGAVIEREERGRRTQTVTDTAFEGDLRDPFQYHDRTVTRTWPAYWQYPSMDQGVDATGLPADPASIRHMLTQVAQTTTLRKKADGTSIFLNSKVDTWWQPDTGATPNPWIKGGEFVWNGLGVGYAPSSFPGFAPPTQWTPSMLPSPSTGVQPYKSSDNWIMAGATTKYDAFAHALEAVDGDGVYGCSKYGYPYDSSGNSSLPAGNMPVAKFANAQDAETLYWNFEGNNTKNGSSTSTGTNNGTGGPWGTSQSTSDDPMVRLASAYTGERAYSGSLSIPIPTPAQTDGYELRYFVKAVDQTTALASCTSAVSWKQAVSAEGGWWFVRTRVASGSVSLSGTFDDVSVFPWRKNGAPCSVSHYAYDRALGLVTSITGSNGRTTRYKYDHLGRLQMVYDVYGKPTASTKYGPVTPPAVPGF